MEFKESTTTGRFTPFNAINPGDVFEDSCGLGTSKHAFLKLAEGHTVNLITMRLTNRGVFDGEEKFLVIGKLA